MPVILNGHEIQAHRGKSLFDYADFMRVRVPTSCGRGGSCHECIVEVRSGMDGLFPNSRDEYFLSGNYRLACQAIVADPSQTIEFSVLRRQPRILTEGIRPEVELDPYVRRDGDEVTIGGQPSDTYRGRILGLAVDIGTTTVAMNLADLESGEIIATSSFENPQRFGGGDVMNRISFDVGRNRGELRLAIISAINFEVGELIRQANVQRRQIYEVVLVGNTTMRDIAFGIDVQPVGVKPYKSSVELDYETGQRNGTALQSNAQAMGLRVFPRANVYGGPLIGCHVGADVSAGLLATGMDEQEEPVMFVDIGTNTEVVIGNRHGMVAASCPAGPAFEGGQVTYGMPGYDGAVESVRVREGLAEVSTIGGGTVQGICGSGLVDLLYELRTQGLMNELGALETGVREFLFAPEHGMGLSRADISALAQAKSANYCGQFITLRRYGQPVEDISRLYLAGGFANYLDVSRAIGIGFIADFPPERVARAGNAALEGATMMLLSQESRQRVEDLVQRIEHIELETTPDFFEIFVEGCMFKPMPRDVVS
jgi:uncharacterized 2Fe-2S/4Fe-4S cluster protein (DUF4445 family)